MSAVARLFYVFIEVRILGRVVGLRVSHMGGIIGIFIVAGAILIGTMGLRI